VISVICGRASRVGWVSSSWKKWRVQGAVCLQRFAVLVRDQRLATAGKQGVDMPAQLAARVRLTNSGHADKTNVLDAASMAAVAMHHSPWSTAQSQSMSASCVTHQTHDPGRCVGDLPSQIRPWGGTRLMRTVNAPKQEGRLFRRCGNRDEPA
jgi:hypothetical protein